MHVRIYTAPTSQTKKAPPKERDERYGDSTISGSRGFWRLRASELVHVGVERAKALSVVLVGIDGGAAVVERLIGGQLPHEALVGRGDEAAFLDHPVRLRRNA